MKLLQAKFLNALLIASTASARTARVYLSDATKDSTRPIDLLSPSDARLVFAQRLGVSAYHSLHDANQDTVNAINTYSGSQRPLFGHDSLDVKRRAIFAFDDVEDIDSIVSTAAISSRQRFDIHHVPSFDATEILINDLGDQVREMDASGYGLEAGLLSSTNGRWSAHSESGSFGEVNGWKANRFGDALQHTQNGHRRTNATALSSFINRLFNFAEHTNTDVVVIFFEKESSSIFSRSIASTWGKYQLTGRTPQRLPADRPTERPIVDSMDEELPPRPAATHSPSGHDESRPTVLANDTTPIRGILASCYSSKAACERITKNCTGHGECRAKYKTEEGRSSESCYSCNCRAESKDGLTTYWSGPACQKKDLTSAFWTLTIATFFLCGVLAFGLNLLYKVGNEDLPSVLASGVPALGPKH